MGRAKGAPSLPCTIVIKLGTSSIVNETTHQPLLSTLSSVVETVIRLRRAGHKVVLVSSGAIGVGLQRMNMAAKPKSLSGKQALAAIGQGRLIALWDNLFGMFSQPIAQILITRGDISDRTRYLNAVNTLSELLSLGVVPIVNENDTVSVSEIKFGDNDTLSAVTSSMLHADYLFLLTDVDGLYTSNPRKDPEARPIDVVSSVPAIRAQVSTTTLGSKLGTGGMETKLIAAEIATAAGVTTVICSSKKPENIFGIIEYNNHLRGSSTPAVSRDPSPTRFGSGVSLREKLDVSRPPHTVFTPSPFPLRDLKSWTSHTLNPSGTVIIDAGAYLVLARRESGGRLLPAGVLGIIGEFASGQAVRIAIRRSSRCAIADPDSAHLLSISSAQDSATQPSTPTLPPPTTPPSAIPLDADSQLNSLISEFSSLQTPPVHSVQDRGTVVKEKVGEHIHESDLEEVGRGLSNYNSAQIALVKGKKSSQISQILGYADSEYVVENITIRVPP